jgi:AraC family transcriptional regulator, regulatory protein of adaptative response / methylated-DNA-[protein]-cysteine methyltransferase
MEHPNNSFLQLSEDYYRIEQAILFLQANYRSQPSLAEIAGAVYLSEYHFQRLFTRWAGISPKRFLQYLTKENAKALLEGSGSLLETAMETGLSSTSRLHDLFVTCEAVTPGQYKQRGLGLQISYGFHKTPFGECLLALTDRGVCALTFILPGQRQDALESLQRRWPLASLDENLPTSGAAARQAFANFTPESWIGEGESISKPGAPLPVFLSGTNFQIKVWEALLRIPPGRAVSYQDIADYLGTPRAVRAVGQAVARNPIVYLIPCHRVIRSLGAFGDYQGGRARKQAILGWELAHREIEPV